MMEIQMVAVWAASFDGFFFWNENQVWMSFSALS